MFSELNCQVSVRSKSRRFCSFKGCSSDHLKTRNGAITFFSFPVKDTERCSAWITNSGREEFRYLTPKELGEKRICELHFHDNMFSNFFKTNLKKQAIPTIWEKHMPELIEIVDDDSSNECDGSIVCEESRMNNSSSLNGHYNNDLNEYETNIHNSTNGSILSSVLNESTSNRLQEVPISPSKESSLLHEQSSVVSTTEGTTKEYNSVDTISKQNHSKKKNTKFHNLPPETTHTEFYFQQCSELEPEETNTNSMPEPPDGELPLFVQQDSVMSLAGEHDNSDHIEPLAKRRRRDKDDDDLAEQMRNTMKHLKNITSVFTNNEDEFELFGKSVAIQLKKMSLCTALLVQAKIQNLLSEHRISDIQKKAGECKAVKKLSEKKDEEKEDNKKSEEDTEAPAPSPPLSLNCASELSDTEI